MRRLDSITDEMNGVVTYEVAGGQRITLDARAVREEGAVQLLRQCGVEPCDADEPENLPVFQSGRQVGWMHRTFDPMFTRPLSAFYDGIRPGDFRRDGDGWIADPMLGPGDLEAIPTFRARQAQTD